MADLKYELDLEVKDALKGLKLFKKGLNDSDKAIDKLDDSSNKLTKTLGGMKTALVGLVGSLGLGALVKSSLDAADAIGKVANKTGFSITALQELRFVADQAGIASGTLDTSLQRFSRRVGEAAQGTGVLSKDLTKMGIAIKNSDGSMRNINDVFTDYMNGIRNATSEQEKLRLAIAAFDTEGGNMVNMLGETAGAFADMRQEAQRLGVVISQDTVKKAVDANDAWAKVKMQFQAIAMTVAGELGPALTQLGNQLSGLLSDPEAINKLAEGMKSFGDGILYAAKMLGILFENFKAFALAFATFKIAVITGLFTELGLVLTGISTAFIGLTGTSAIFSTALVSLRAVVIALLSTFARFSVIGLAIWGIYEAFRFLFGAVSDTDEAMKKLNSSTDAFTNKDLGVFQKKLDEINTDIANYERIPYLGDAQTKKLASLKKEQAEIIALIEKGKVKIAEAAAGPITPLELPAIKYKPAELPDLCAETKDIANLPAMDGAVKQFEAYKRELESVRTAFNPLKRATEDYKRNQMLLKGALAEGMMTADEYKISMGNLTEQFEDFKKSLAGPEMNAHVKAMKEMNEEAKSVAAAYTPVSTQMAKFKKTREQLNYAVKRGLIDEKKYKEAIKNLDKEMKAFNKSQLKESKKWGDGWKRAMDDYVEHSRDAASQAEDAFKTATQGMEDAIVGFAKTGKFEWKSFLDDLVDQLLRAQIQQLMGNIFSAFNTPSAPAVAAPTTSAPAPTSSGSSGSSALGDLLKSGVNWFAGLFADGGLIPGGQVGIVGERGPELISGPAQITPMTGMGSNVTYNINAVDAPSFRQMIARDPEFMFAVSEQGRRSLPQFS